MAARVTVDKGMVGKAVVDKGKGVKAGVGRVGDAKVEGAWVAVAPTPVNLSRMDHRARVVKADRSRISRPRSSIRTAT